jgi:hypothetical protein
MLEFEGVLNQILDSSLKICICEIGLARYSINSFEMLKYDAFEILKENFKKKRKKVYFASLNYLESQFFLTEIEKRRT